MSSLKQRSRQTITNATSKHTNKITNTDQVAIQSLGTVTPQQGGNNDSWLAHQTAMQLYLQESTNVWARFNALLVAQGIFLAVLGQLLSTGNSALSILLKPLSVIGLLVCILWFAITARGFGYHDAYFNFAKQQQKQTVIFQGFPLQPARMPWWTFYTWRIPIRISAYLVIILFAIIYGIIELYLFGLL